MLSLKAEFIELARQFDDNVNSEEFAKEYNKQKSNKNLRNFISNESNRISSVTKTSEEICTVLKSPKKEPEIQNDNTLQMLITACSSIEMLVERSNQFN